MLRLTVSDDPLDVSIRYERDEYNRPVVTVVRLTFPTVSNWESVGVAACHPLDKPSKRVGRIVAFKDALTRAGKVFTKRERRELWLQFLSLTGGVERISRNVQKENREVR